MLLKLDYTIWKIPSTRNTNTHIQTVRTIARNAMAGIWMPICLLWLWPTFNECYKWNRGGRCDALINESSHCLLTFFCSIPLLCCFAACTLPLPFLSRLLIWNLTLSCFFLKSIFRMKWEHKWQRTRRQLKKKKCIFTHFMQHLLFTYFDWNGCFFVLVRHFDHVPQFITPFHVVRLLFFFIAAQIEYVKYRVTVAN